MRQIFGPLAPLAGLVRSAFALARKGLDEYKTDYRGKYDGTIANTNAEGVKWIKTHVGRDVKPWQCNRTDCVSLIGKSLYEEMNDYVYERESTLAAAEVPGAANALRALTVVGDVFVVTNRPLRRIAYI